MTALDLDGPAAPPRVNGEFVFAAPWERRVFGIAMALVEGGLDYEDFRQRLIARIAEDETRPYWASWQRALEDVSESACAITPAALDSRHSSLVARPHGHDHRH